MTVGEIRKAIEGLPDEAFVTLYQHFTEDSEGSALIDLIHVGADGDRLAIMAEVTVFDMDDDDDDDDWEDTST
jgi:hypothetical protein